MILTAARLTALRTETAKDLLDYYNNPVTTPPEADSIVAHGFGKRRHQQWRDARTMVDRALKAGISVRQLAVDTHLPGTLIIDLIGDPDRRVEALNAEWHHLDRALKQVRSAQRREARAMHAEAMAKRAAGGEQKKKDLAQLFGVSRVTLDAWLSATD